MTSHNLTNLADEVMFGRNLLHKFLAQWKASIHDIINKKIKTVFRECHTVISKGQISKKYIYIFHFYFNNLATLSNGH
jgi:hypothetical protein